MKLTGAPSVAWAALQAVCGPIPRGEAAAAVKATAADPGFGWGELLELAIDGRVLCLLAEAITLPGADISVPPRLMRFLARQLRCSLHATSVFRAEAARITAAADRAGVNFAVVRGLAVESALYGGSGARQFSDIDILVSPRDFPLLSVALTGLEYRPKDNAAVDHAVAPQLPGSQPLMVTFTRHHQDFIVPRLAVDVITSYPGRPVNVPSRVEEALHRRTRQRLPGLPGRYLPVLATADQFALTMVTIGQSIEPSSPHEPSLSLCADAMRLAPYVKGRWSAEPGLMRAVALAEQWIADAFPAFSGALGTAQASLTACTVQAETAALP
jgi:hypothetical protein